MRCTPQGHSPCDDARLKKVSDTMTAPRPLRTRSMHRLALALTGLTVSALALTGCVTNTEGAAGGSAVPTSTTEITRSEAAAALVPEEIAKTGVLRVGTDTTYAPNQFEDANGAPTGWEVELVEAVGKKLGLEIEWKKLLFDQIIPQVSGNTLDMGSSSFTDTLERQQSVDFVDFYNAGLQYARGKDVAELPAELCGLTISVQATTTSDDYLVAASDECTAAGKPAVEILRSDAQDEATNNAALGRADYMLADSPITQYGVKQSNGALVLTGDIFDTAPYGLVFQKDSKLSAAAQAALQELIDDGTYTEILTNWGVQAGGQTQAVINGVK